MLNLFAPKLPVTEVQRVWIDDAFARLFDLFGRDICKTVPVILPDLVHFPKEFDGSEEWAEMVLAQVCRFMNVRRERIRLDWYDVTGPEEELKKHMPYWEGNGVGGPSGTYRQGEGDTVHIRLNR